MLHQIQFYTVEHTESKQGFVISYAIKCRLNATSDAHLSCKMIMMGVFAKSLICNSQPDFLPDSGCFWAGLNRGLRHRGQRHLRGDRADSTISQRLQAQTVYWQAIVACNLVVLQQGEDVAFVWQYGCRSGRAERQRTGKQMRIPPFPLPPFKLVRFLFSGVCCLFDSKRQTVL